MSVYCVVVFTVQGSLNSRACLLCARPSILVSVQSNVWLFPWVCSAGSEFGSRRFMAFLCSVSLVSIFLDVCPMYCFEQSLHGII